MALDRPTRDHGWDAHVHLVSRVAACPCSRRAYVALEAPSQLASRGGPRDLDARRSMLERCHDPDPWWDCLSSERNHVAYAQIRSGDGDPQAAPVQNNARSLSYGIFSPARNAAASRIDERRVDFGHTLRHRHGTNTIGIVFATRISF